MNAEDRADSIHMVQALASVAAIVRRRFPDARTNLAPWRDDPETRRWSEAETLDLAFHFPGWSPRLECRSLLLQLRLQDSAMQTEVSPRLLGVLMRGMTHAGERWRLATIGDWQLSGSHLPRKQQQQQLREICRDLYGLFPPDVTAVTSA